MTSDKRDTLSITSVHEPESPACQLTLGVGCDRDTSLHTLTQAVDQALALAAADNASVEAIATIDKKHDEPAILTLAAQRGWPLLFFSAAQLSQIEVPHPSETVRRYMGTPAVAEAAALLAAATHQGNLLLEKLKFRGSDGKHATVSIARKD